MPKFKITNISQTHKDGAKNFFLTEAGKLIKPGEHCVCNRLDNGTQAQIDAGLMKCEQGDFKLPSIFDEDKPKAEVPAVSPKTLAADADAKAKDDAKAESDAKAKAEADAVAEAKAGAAAADDKPEAEMTRAEKKAAAKKAKAESRGNG